MKNKLCNLYLYSFEADNIIRSYVNKKKVLIQLYSDFFLFNGTWDKGDSRNVKLKKKVTGRSQCRLRD